MGNARWDNNDWDRYATTTSRQSRAANFTSKTMTSDYDPKTIRIRESVDSDANPNSTPIIVALDDTGSMGEIPQRLVQGKLGTLMEELLARRPVPDPHLMFMAVGDVLFDRAPLQVTQFEADIRIADQLRALYLEGGGGGNGCESYHLPWYFAASKVKADAAIKRQRKGYLITVGDEEIPDALTPDQIARVFGPDDVPQAPLSLKELLGMAEQNFHVFHIMVEQGSHYRAYGDRVREGWRDLLGERAIPLSDYDHLAEVIVALIQFTEQRYVSAAAAVATWQGPAAKTIGHALHALTVRPDADAGGLVRL